MMLKIRAPREGEGNFLKAYMVLPDGSEPVLIATLHVSAAERHPEVFEQWKDLLTLLLKKELESLGLNVERIVEERPHESN